MTTPKKSAGKVVKAWGLKDSYDGSIYKETFFSRDEACTRRDRIYGISKWKNKVIRVEIREVNPERRIKSSDKIWRTK